MKNSFKTLVVNNYVTLYSKVSESTLGVLRRFVFLCKVLT